MSPKKQMIGRLIRSENLLLAMASRRLIGNPLISRSFKTSQPLLIKEKMTELGQQLAGSIKISGPLSVSTFMRSCLVHPKTGYYMNRDVFGTSGDFITSPEISQVFGELIAIWFIYSIKQQNITSNIRIVELGPGRGTLMADFLRTVSAFPDIFPLIKQSNLVEASPALQGIQKESLSKFGKAISWNDRLQDVPNDGFTFFLAHEFFDALPIYQFQARTISIGL